MAFVVNDFLVGGVQRLHVDLLGRIDRARFDVSLVTLFDFPERDTFYELLPHDVSVHRLSFRGAWDVRGWLSFVRTIRALRPHVVISNLFLSNLVSRALKPLFGYACIAVEHNTYIHKTSLEIFLDRLLARLTFSIVAVSETVKTFTARQEHIPLPKFTVVNDGVDTRAVRERLESHRARPADLGLPEGRRFIISVARLLPQKNHALLIDGFARFAASHPEYDLLILGEGTLMPKLVRQAAELGIGDRVHLLGSKKDVVPYYAVSDLFVSTSRIEGFGIAHVEALACGLPILSTKTAGPDEMIEEGENGFFIEESTPQAVASGMEKVAGHLAKLAPNAAPTASRYDIERTVRAYESLIERAALA